MTLIDHSARRLFIGRTARLLVAGAVLPLAGPALAALPRNAQRLDFEHLHTNESLSVVFRIGNKYVPRALDALNHLLRDHYTDEVGRIDPPLFDLLYQTRQELGSREPFQIISGYRCPTTNTRLRQSGGGGVARQSLHMEGRAIDVRLGDVPLADLRDAAISLNGGGVGFYPREEFVHLDTGKVRYW